MFCLVYHAGMKEANVEEKKQQKPCVCQNPRISLQKIQPDLQKFDA